MHTIFVLAGVLLFFWGLRQSGFRTSLEFKILLGIILMFPSFGISLAVGYYIGMFVYAQALLPFLYALPKSISLFLKGKIRFAAIAVCFVAPIFWYVLFVILFWVSEKYAPFLYRYLTSNFAFGLGMSLSLLRLIAFTFFTKRGQESVQKDYEEVFIKKYAKT